MPRHLSDLFAEYEIKAVGLNAATERVRAKGVKFWWVSFRTLEGLVEFIEKIDGSTLYSKTLLIESSSAV